jgi:hypothetical protein
MGEKCPITAKTPEWQYNMPNVCNIFQIAIKYNKIFHYYYLKNNPNWDFWF